MTIRLHDLTGELLEKVSLFFPRLCLAQVSAFVGRSVLLAQELQLAHFEEFTVNFSSMLRLVVWMRQTPPFHPSKTLERLLCL